MSIHRNQLFLLILIVSAFASCKAVFKCDPTADCASANFGNKVPDPDNCYNYYLCINSNGNSVPSDESMPCPDGQYFDQTTVVCRAGTGSCNNVCNKICKTACEADLDLIPDPSNNCSHYFVCISGTPTPFECSGSNRYFNGTGCSANRYDCCDYCVPHCFTAFTQVQDPLDCHKYYLCTVANTTPEESSHFNCSSGGFNTATGVCDPALGTCESYCPTTLNEDYEDFIIE